MSQQQIERRLLLPLVIGGLIAFGGVIWLLTTTIFVMRASIGPGVVVKVEKRDDSSAWYATFTFADAKGINHTQETWFLSPTTCPTIQAGNKVRVLYDAASPEYAKIDSFPTIWFGPLFFSGLGAFFGCGTAITLVVMRRMTQLRLQQTE